MLANIAFRGIGSTRSLFRYLRAKTAQRLGKLHQGANKAAIALAEICEPRGGSDKRCNLMVDARGRYPIAIHAASGESRRHARRCLSDINRNRNGSR